MKAQIHTFSKWVDLELNSNALLKEKYINLLEGAGFGIVGVSEKEFMPQGYTLVVLLAESHFALHTFPEHKEYYIELSSCVKTPFKEFILKFFKSNG